MKQPTAQPARPRRRPRALNAAILAAAVLALALGTAGATWAGSQTQTQHARGADSFGLTAIDFLPADSPVSLPTGCWMSPTSVLVSTYGNTVFHTTTNPANDFWLTTTFTGDGAVWPILFDSHGQPVRNQDGNVVPDTSHAPQATGHLTTWFGIEDNNRNGVEHATLSFSGTDTSGAPVTMHGRFQFATNANGTPVVMNGGITC